MSSKARFDNTFSRKNKETPTPTPTAISSAACTPEKKTNTVKNNEKLLPSKPNPLKLVIKTANSKPKNPPPDSAKPESKPKTQKKTDEKLNQKRKPDTHNAGPQTKKMKKKEFAAPEKETVVGLAAVTNNEVNGNTEAEKKKKKKKKTAAVVKKNKSEAKPKKGDGENVNVSGERAAKKAVDLSRKVKGNNEEEEVVFPAARISRIVKSEGSDCRLSSEAVFLINKASEKFIELFSEDAYGCAIEDRKRSILYKHLSSVVGKGKRFDFLSDFVPEKVTAEKALAARKSPEKLPYEVS